MECPGCRLLFVRAPTFDGLRVPKNLGCGHAVCLSCAQASSKGGALDCPVSSCKQSNFVPDTAALPTCLPLLELLEGICGGYVTAEMLAARLARESVRCRLIHCSYV
jgi:hypothetical protein